MAASASRRVPADRFGRWRTSRPGSQTGRWRTMEGPGDGELADRPRGFGVAALASQLRFVLAALASRLRPRGFGLVASASRHHLPPGPEDGDDEWEEARRKTPPCFVLAATSSRFRPRGLGPFVLAASSSRLRPRGPLAIGVGLRRGRRVDLVAWASWRRPRRQPRGFGLAASASQHRPRPRTGIAAWPSRLQPLVMARAKRLMSMHQCNNYCISNIGGRERAGRAPRPGFVFRSKSCRGS